MSCACVLASHEHCVRAWACIYAHHAVGQPQHQGGATTTMGTDGSPHGGTLLGRAMLSQLVVVAINYDFVRTLKLYDLAWYAK